MKQSDLQRLVERVSLQFFKKPFKHTATFNPRLRTTGGRYILQTHNIELNKKYYEAFGEEELIAIIKHELCHYHLHLEGKGYRHRDQDFRDLLRQVQAPRYCRPLPQQAQQRTKKVYVYVCSKCSLKYRRKKRVNTDKYVCGQCGGKLMLDNGGEI
ncbi:SprT family protein [Geobacillus sp. NFOSA3]|jgi:SprT-like protein|uniref:Protein SprT-like n=3 Tax=Anoxybacillaceae TaxID=3120669 RepID=SPRTL_GEOSW|nr:MULTISPECIES: SprT family protein [Bacillaceae]C5D4D8.1 RecName: Full=Protein SprT-like [Geobacillus sp. WCH70]NNU94614.1 SprT family protein [Geobacillus sp. NFOSA3]OQO98845.1 SprT family protein [Geobacillus sp. 44C]PDM39647.1 SprT family protein [Parageobacillus yumthangensis]MED4971148.1 SprT family protein [Parageobacillus toebii]MED4990511.1 SprT family protein [Parageobacillus toebii]